MNVTFIGRVILLVCSLLLMAWQTSAQKKSTSGYIITLQNDTLAGKVIDKGNFANSHAIQFIDDRTGKSRVYTPEEITGFGKDPDQFFVSQDLTSSAAAKKLFSRLIVKGYTRLYAAVPKNGNPLYVLQKNDGGLLLLDKKNYFGLLKYTFNDCPALKFDQSTRKTSSYSEAALRKLVSRYNQYMAPQTVQTVYRQKRKVNYGVMAGTAVNHYAYSFGSELYSPRGDYGWHSTPLLGLFCGLPIGQKLEVEGQILYGQYRGIHTRHHTNGIYGDQPFRIQFHYLNAPLLIRCYFWNRIYLNTGINLNFRLHSAGSQTFMGVTERYEGYPTRLSVGAVLGAGYKLRVLKRTFSLEGRVSSNRIQDGATQVASFDSYQVLLRVNMNK